MPRNDHEKWQMDLEEYIRQGEPEQSEKSTAWKTAIGLQDVDGLKTSEYLLETSYEGLSAGDAVKHIANFTSGIWQIHPFCEGDTRSTAVFIIKYLKTFGFSVNNEIFAENSWYFRNSLARANYNDLGKGISATTIYLERFFENLLLGYQNELKNRFIHVDYREQSAKVPSSKSQNGTMKITLEEMAIIKVLQAEPTATQKRIAELTGKSERTIKRRTVEMQEKGLIRRENGKRNGRWEVLI